MVFTGFTVFACFLANASASFISFSRRFSSSLALRIASFLANASASLVNVADRQAAIQQAVDLAGPDGLVAVLGKGHETGQEVAGAVTPFDDRAALRRALGGAQ